MMWQFGETLVYGGGPGEMSEKPGGGEWRLFATDPGRTRPKNPSGWDY